MKRRCHVIEVVRPGVDGGCPFDGCRVASLLVEVEYAEPVGDEVQAPKAEGLEWLEDGWNPHLDGRDCGELQRAKMNHIVGSCHGGSGGKMGDPMTKRC